jgi:hypothetical protein
MNMKNEHLGARILMFVGLRLLHELNHARKPEHLANAPKVSHSNIQTADTKGATLI